MCENGIKRVYEGSNEDVEYLRDVGEAAETFSRLERNKAEQLARQAKYHEMGNYKKAVEALNGYTRTRVEKALAGIVGKDITLQNRDEYEFRTVTVKKWEYIKGSIVKVYHDRGTSTIDLDNDMTIDGREYVKLGSEIDKALNTTMIDEMTTLFGNDIANKAIDIYEEELAQDLNYDRDHADHLMDIVDHYTEIIGQMGLRGEPVTVQFLEEVLINGVQEDNVKGEAIPEANVMKLVQGHTKYNTKLEIYVHELQHLMLHPFLDPKSPSYNRELAVATDRLRKAMSIAIKPADLIADMQNPSAEDIRRAEKMHKYMFFNGEAANSEFLAFATTNKNVMNAMNKQGVYKPLMEQIKNPKGTLQKLWNIVTKLVNAVHKAIKMSSETEKPGMSGHQAAMNIMTKLAELNREQKDEANGKVFDTINDTIEKWDDKVGKYTRDVEDTKEEYKKELAKTLRMKSKFDKMIDKVWKIKLLANARSVMIRNNLFSSLYNLKNNEDVAKFYELFRRTKKVVDKTMVDVKNFTRDMLDKELKFNELDKGTRKAMTTVLLNTDAKALGTIDDLERYLNNEQELEDLVRALKSKVTQKTSLHATALASLLNTNKMHLHNGYFNAESIAKFVEGDASPEKIKQIDILVSAIALLKANKQDKAIVAKALKTHKESIGYTLEMLRTREAKLLDSGYKDASWAYAKGSKQESYTGNISYYIVPKEEAEKLKKAKIYTIEKHEDLSRIMGEEMMLVAGEAFEVPYTEGAISMVQLKNEGDSLRRILEASGKYAEKDVQDLIDNEIDMVGKNTYGSLVAERNHKGEPFDYRVRIPHEIKADYLQLDNDFVETVAATVGNISHKDEAIANNRAIVNYLMGFYDKYKNDPEFKFVEITPDNEYKEYWSRLPYYLKKMVTRENAGQEVLYVEESMLVNTFGYKDVSIANTEWMQGHKRLQAWGRKGEKVIQELAARWKKLVVPTLMSTVEGNLQSNMVVSMQYMQDKDPIEFGKKWLGMWSEMERYHETSKELIQAQLKADGGDKDAAAKVKSLQKELESNPMHPIINDGQYTSLLEDIDLGEGKQGILEGQVQKMFDRIKKSDRQQEERPQFD